MAAIFFSKAFWEAVGIGAIALAIFLFIQHYKSLTERAAQADVLQTQLDASNVRADKLADLGAKIDGARLDFDNRFSAFEGMKSDVLSSVNLALAHTPARTDPRCAPTAADRQLFNDAIQRLVGLGSNPEAAPVPPGAGAAH